MLGYTKSNAEIYGYAARFSIAEFYSARNKEKSKQASKQIRGKITQSTTGLSNN